MTTQPGERTWSEIDQTAPLAGCEGLHAAQEEPILYIDQYRLSRDCIARQLAHHLPEFTIETVATAEDVSARDSNASRFALVILHAHMARAGEDRVAAQLMLLARLAPSVPLVLLSDVDEPEAVGEAIHLGVRGYVVTRQSVRQAADAIRTIKAGGAVMPSGPLALPGLASPAGGSQAILARPHVRFTRRQLDVLTRLWQGKPNKLIAHELAMSQSTVKVHIRLIMKKLHATNRTQVVLLTRPSEEGAGLTRGAA